MEVKKMEPKDAVDNFIRQIKLAPTLSATSLDPGYLIEALLYRKVIGYEEAYKLKEKLKNWREVYN
jgi:hypothetical protein